VENGSNTKKTISDLPMYLVLHGKFMKTKGGKVGLIFLAQNPLPKNNSLPTSIIGVCNRCKS